MLQSLDDQLDEIHHSCSGLRVFSTERIKKGFQLERQPTSTTTNTGAWQICKSIQLFIPDLPFASYATRRRLDACSAPVALFFFFCIWKVGLAFVCDSSCTYHILDSQRNTRSQGTSRAFPRLVRQWKTAKRSFVVIAQRGGCNLTSTRSLSHREAERWFREFCLPIKGTGRYLQLQKRARARRDVVDGQAPGSAGHRGC